MIFDGTIRSMSVFISEIPIEQEQAIADLVLRYQADAEMNPFPDMELLRQAQTLLHQHLQETAIVTADLAILSVVLTYHLETFRDGIKTMRQYLSQSLPDCHYAWAWWHIIDFLALLRESAQMVDEQRNLVAWTRQTMPLQHRLFSLSDASQAACWQMEHQEDEWHELCDLLLEGTPIIEETRWERFYLLRTKFTLYAMRDAITRSESILPHLDKLLEEDASWVDTTEMQLEVRALHLKQSMIEKDIESLRIQGEQGYREWLALAAQQPEPTHEQCRTQRKLINNLGWPLYKAGQYDLAQICFEQAAHLKTLHALTYLWLAACVWKTTGNREYVTEWLSQAQARITSETYSRLFAAIPELDDFRIKTAEVVS